MINLHKYQQFLVQKPEIDADASFMQIMKENIALQALLEKGPFVGYVFNYKTLKYNYLNKPGFMRLLRLPDSYHYDMMMEVGLAHAYTQLHPSDAKIVQNDCFGQLFQTFKKVPSEQLEKVRFSYNYRARYGNDSGYGHFLSQFCMIADTVTGEPLFNVGTLADISHLKKDNRIVFAANFFDAELGLQDFAMEFWPDDSNKHLLSERELEIVKLLAQGKKPEEIADTLFISPFTVRAHKRKIFEKLNVHKTSELVSVLAKEGIL